MVNVNGADHPESLHLVGIDHLIEMRASLCNNLMPQAGASIVDMS